MSLRRQLVLGLTVGNWRLTHLPSHHSLAFVLRSLILRTGVTYAIDIGAHVGEYHDLLCNEVVFSSPVHSFEPARRSFGRLKQKALAGPGWHVHHLALGATSGNWLSTRSMSAFSTHFAPLWRTES